jgi:hypothetical protein
LPPPIREEEKDALLWQLTAITDEYFEYIYILLALHTFCIAYLLQNMQEFLYAKIRKIYIKPIGLNLLMNLTSTLIVLYWLCKHYFEFTVNLDKYDERKRKRIVIDRMQEDEFFHMQLIIAILTAIQF